MFRAGSMPTRLPPRVLRNTQWAAVMTTDGAISVPLQLPVERPRVISMNASGTAVSSPT
jgi:hypothetical protein